MEFLEKTFSIHSRLIENTVFLQTIYKRTGEIIHEVSTRVATEYEALKITESYKYFMLKGKDNYLSGVQMIMLRDVTEHFNLDVKDKPINEILNEVKKISLKTNNAQEFQVK